jgi:hypothetical protein
LTRRPWRALAIAIGAMSIGAAAGAIATTLRPQIADQPGVAPTSAMPDATGVSRTHETSGANNAHTVARTRRTTRPPAQPMPSGVAWMIAGAERALSLHGSAPVPDRHVMTCAPGSGPWAVPFNWPDRPYRVSWHGESPVLFTIEESGFAGAMPLSALGTPSAPSWMQAPARLAVIGANGPADGTLMLTAVTVPAAADPNAAMVERERVIPAPIGLRAGRGATGRIDYAGDEDAWLVPGLDASFHAWVTAVGGTITATLAQGERTIWSQNARPGETVSSPVLWRAIDAPRAAVVLRISGDNGATYGVRVERGALETQRESRVNNALVESEPVEVGRPFVGRLESVGDVDHLIATVNDAGWYTAHVTAIDNVNLILEWDRGVVIDTNGPGGAETLEPVYVPRGLAHLCVRAHGSDHDPDTTYAIQLRRVPRPDGAEIPAETGESRARALLARELDARGGFAACFGFDVSVVDVRFATPTTSGEIRVTYARGGRLRIDYVNAGLTLIRNGASSWTVRGGAVADRQSDTEIDMLERSISDFFRTLLLMFEPGWTLDAQPDEATLDGRDVLWMTGSGHCELRMAFDAKTGLLMRRERRRPGEEGWRSALFRRYVSTDAGMIPFDRVGIAEGGTSTVEVTAVTINPAIDPALFQRP